MKEVQRGYFLIKYDKNRVKKKVVGKDVAWARMPTKNIWRFKERNGIKKELLLLLFQFQLVKQQL